MYRHYGVAGTVTCIVTVGLQVPCHVSSLWVAGTVPCIVTVGCRYRDMYQWEDGTLSHSNRYTRFAWPPSSGTIDRAGSLLIVPASYKDPDFSKVFLCEKEELSETPAANNGLSNKPQVERPKSDDDSINFSYVVCSSGHYTHRFLACDAQSHCMQRGPSRQGSGSNDALIALCMSVLDTLFTCRNGVEHVPYSLVCDHSQDCLDSSDEDFCDHPSCSGSRLFECASKQVKHKKNAKHVLMYALIYVLLHVCNGPRVM